MDIDGGPSPPVEGTHAAMERNDEEDEGEAVNAAAAVEEDEQEGDEANLSTLGLLTEARAKAKEVKQVLTPLVQDPAHFIQTLRSLCKFEDANDVESDVVRVAALLAFFSLLSESRLGFRKDLAEFFLRELDQYPKGALPYLANALIKYGFSRKASHDGKMFVFLHSLVSRVSAADQVVLGSSYRASWIN
eukprot:TRINITY_DN2574_c0_g2_i1.p1 TRINITY_DN2574_c0_g2~~TRINITY_DN2574_c0_g2_i1.p1  ORF type:complete len:222 (+),score=47.27 TRINITY_DN2574_c0_g2_i1:97-666(+)